MWLLSVLHRAAELGRRFLHGQEATGRTDARLMLAMRFDRRAQGGRRLKKGSKLIQRRAEGAATRIERTVPANVIVIEVVSKFVGPRASIGDVERFFTACESGREV